MNTIISLAGLDPDSYDLELDAGMRDVSAASELLKHYDTRQMRCYPREHANQFRGKRRCRVLRACGNHTDSESSLFLV